MSKITNEELKEYYDIIANVYIKRFCDKQDISFDGWIADDIGGIASFIDQYFFNYNDIVYDITNNCEKGLILSWQDCNMELYEKGINTINYHSYTRGLRL